MSQEPINSMSAPSIITNPTSIEKIDGGVIRGRDVRFLLKNANIDPVVLGVLELMAEQSYHTHKENIAIAGAISQMSEIVSAFATIAERMKEALVSMGHKVEDVEIKQ